MDAIIAQEHTEFLGASHAEAEATAADMELPIMPRPEVFFVLSEGDHDDP